MSDLQDQNTLQGQRKTSILVVSHPPSIESNECNAPVILKTKFPLYVPGTGVTLSAGCGRMMDNRQLSCLPDEHSDDLKKTSRVFYFQFWPDYACSATCTTATTKASTAVAGNGIDVDKWDYFARDCYHLGIHPHNLTNNKMATQHVQHNTMATHQGVDTSMLRKANWN
ncbi:unnamed protein product [Leuciscus chuanchicus]